MDWKCQTNTLYIHSSIKPSSVSLSEFPNYEWNKHSEILQRWKEWIFFYCTAVQFITALFLQIPLEAQNLSYFFIK